VSCKELLKKLGINLIWSDSLGAKSFSVSVEGSEGIIVIDPGAAQMQPSYPLPKSKKRELRAKAIGSIESWCWRAKALIITHYHYDHHIIPTDPDVKSPIKMWLSRKLLIVKNPNMYINESQWFRARKFLNELLKLVGDDISRYLIKPEAVDFEDPVNNLSIALSKDFGDYRSRREELLLKGKSWFMNLVRKLWSKEPWVTEIKLNEGSRIVWGDGKEFMFGDIYIKVLEPWFHGIEYDRTGWVTPVLIRKGNYVIFYSSDLMGPVIEDYAERIAKLKADVLILDGPPTYLFPYMFNRINLRRAIDNIVSITNSKPKLIIYDHHLLRERKWREYVSEVFVEAEKNGVMFLTVAECLGKKPLIDML